LPVATRVATERKGCAGAHPIGQHAPAQGSRLDLRACCRPPADSGASRNTLGVRAAGTWGRSGMAPGASGRSRTRCAVPGRTDSRSPPACAAPPARSRGGSCSDRAAIASNPSMGRAYSPGRRSGTADRVSRSLDPRGVECPPGNAYRQCHRSGSAAEIRGQQAAALPRRKTCFRLPAGRNHPIRSRRATGQARWRRGLQNRRSKVWCARLEALRSPLITPIVYTILRDFVLRAN